MERILITGGAGFIGSRLSLRLVEQGYEVTVMDNLSKQIHSDTPGQSFLYNSIKDKVRFIHGDVRSLSDWQKAIDGNDVIVHLAAHKASSPYHFGRQSRRQMKRTHVELVLKEDTRKSAQQTKSVGSVNGKVKSVPKPVEKKVELENIRQGRKGPDYKYVLLFFYVVMNFIALGYALKRELNREL